VAVSIRIDVHNQFINRLLRSPAGPLARNMLTRGNRVRREARRRINSQSGALARSITVDVIVENGGAGVRVGTSLHYARYVHDGTGLYGPRHRPIRPTRRKALAFSGGTGTVIVASSSGQRGTKFLSEALSAAG
jgi:hypothetical protein